MFDLTKFSARVYETQRKNWGHIERTPVEDLALIVTEVAEAIEDIRDDNLSMTYDLDSGKPKGLPTEVADIIIRTLNFATHHGIDIEHALEVKADYNDTRPLAHGGKKL